jgi:hypothetical protein
MINWKRLSYSLSIAIVITAVAYVFADIGGTVLLLPGVIGGLVFQALMMVVSDEFVFTWRASVSLLVNTAFYTGLSYGILSLVSTFREQRNQAVGAAGDIEAENGGGAQPRRRGVSNGIRLLVSFLVAFILAGATFFDAVSQLQSIFPLFVSRFLHFPAHLYCAYLKATQPLPTDEVALFKMGQDIECFFVDVALNIPYYTALIFGAWWLIEKWRNRPAR